MPLLLFKVLLCPFKPIGKLCQTNPACYPPPSEIRKTMLVLNFVIPAGWGTCMLCFEGAPASAHLWGRAGSLHPLLSSCDSSRRHLSLLALCKHVAEPAQPVGGGSGHLSPFPPLSPAAANPAAGERLLQATIGMSLPQRPKGQWLRKPFKGL